MGFNSIKNGMVIIGAGNVATHLASALNSAEFSIRCIYSKTHTSAKELALKINSDYTDDLKKIPLDADIYFLAVKDEAIEEIVKKLKTNSAKIVHTAGSVSINVFKGYFENYGVFYPLQTFTKSRSLDFSNIPICIEASNKELEDTLIFIAKKLSNSVHLIDSGRREILHLSAVFACNFTNHMYSVATEIIRQSGISFEILKPLIIETASKAIASNPFSAQTGPAARNDKNVMQKHMKMLKDKDEFEKIYRFVSESIIKLKKETDN